MGMCVISDNVEFMADVSCSTNRLRGAGVGRLLGLGVGWPRVGTPMGVSSGTTNGASQLGQFPLRPAYLSCTRNLD